MRTGGPTRRSGRRPFPGKSYDEVVRATERDNFLTPEQALEFGIIDRVLVSRSDMTEKN